MSQYENADYKFTPVLLKQFVTVEHTVGSEHSLYNITQPASINAFKGEGVDIVSVGAQVGCLYKQYTSRDLCGSC